MFIIILIVWIEGKGGTFFSQIRIGRNGKPFKLLKFRSMKSNSDTDLQLTIGNNDSRITPVGRFLRRFKLDELPQLFNVLRGEMSLVGPRPEVPKYVEMYSRDQLDALRVKPGITDLASIEYIDENTILANSLNPERDYIDIILPRKIELSLKYAQNPTITSYFSILLKTILAIFRL